MTPQELHTDIASGKFKPAYYFFGQEDFRIIEAEKYVASQYLPNRQLITNYRRLDGRKIAASDLIAELSVYPMLGERQVFAVASFQSYKPTEIQRVLKYLEPPDPNRIVIFSSPADKAPKKSSAFYLTMTRSAEVVEFPRLRREEARKLITGKLQKQNLKIEPEAMELLLELLSGNRGALEVEIEKLLNFKADAPAATVTVGDIQGLTSGYVVYSIFELANFIIEGNTRKTLDEIRVLIAEGSGPTGILWALGNHFVLLYLVKNGKPLEPNRRWLARKLQPQTGKYSNEQLEEMIIRIAEADSGMRGRIEMKAEMQLETLALRLLQAAGSQIDG